MRKKIMIAAVAVLVLLIGGLLAVPYLVNVNQYHARIQSELQKRLGRPVTLGRMQLKMFPPAFRVENAAIGEDSRFGKGKAFATAGELYVSAALLPLLRGEVQVKSLELTRPQIELIRDARGVWNFASLGQPKPAAGQPAPGQQAQTAQDQSEFSLDHFAVHDGQVAITDLMEKKPRTVYQNISLAVDGYRPGKAFDFELAAKLAGKSDQRVSIEGEAGPLNAVMAQTPFDGSFNVQQVQVEALQSFLDLPALQGMAGTLTGKGSLKNEGGKFATSGNLEVEGMKVRGVEVGYPLSADFDVDGDLNAETFQINRGKLNLGKTPVEITGTLNTRPDPIQIDVRLKANDASISEAARLAAAFGVAFNARTKVDGKITADLRATGAANQPRMQGTLRARNLDVSGGELQQPVRIPAIDLQLSPETITSNQFTATSGATSVGAQFALSQYAGPASQVRASISSRNAQLGELLSIAKAYGISAAEGMSGSGPISLDVQVQGPMKNASALAFSGSGKMGQGTLKVPSLNNTIQVRNLDLRFTANSVVLENVAVKAGETTAAGTLTLRNFSAPQVQFDLRADKFNVQEWQQMTGTAATRASLSVVPQAWAQQAAPSMLLNMTGGGNVAVGTVIYDQLTLSDVTAQVNLDRGVVRLDPVRALMYGGQHVGTIVADLRPTPAVYKISSRVEKVDANRFLSAVSSLDKTLYGLLATSANAQFTSGGSQDIARTLNGDLVLNLADGKIANMDFLHEVSRIAQFTSTRSAVEPFTKLVQMTGNFKVRNGVAHTDNLRAVIEGGTVAAIGDVDLAAQTLNMKVVAVLTRDYSQRVGGTQVGGLMQTALANSKGELVIPALVTGSLKAPKFAPDMQRIAQMKLENLLPSASNPGQMTTGILGAVLGGGSNSGGKAGVGGIVDALTGRKPQTPQPQQAVPQEGTQPQAQPQPEGGVAGALGAILGEVQKKQEQKKKPANPPPPPPQ